MPEFTVKNRPTLAPAVTSLLGSLRRRTRGYMVRQGCAAAIAWLGAAFWLTLAADWFFEPPAIVRILMLAAVVAILAAIFVRLVCRRIMAPITDANAAMILERRFPALDDSLLTAVTLGRRSPDLGDWDEAEWNSTMFEETCREAESRLAEIDLRQVFNPRPLRRHGAAAIVLTASVAFFAVILPNAFCTWADRVLAMSQERWPRYTHLRIEGFESGKPLKAARGSDVDVTVFADAKMVVPTTVSVRYRTEGGGRGSAAMDRHGVARGSNDQEFVYTFRSVLADVHFDVVGGDDRVGDLWIQAVDSPANVPMTLECELPAYMRRKQPPLPVTGIMQIPMGSRVTVHAAGANKELVSVQINSVIGERAQPERKLDADKLAADRRGFTLSLDPLMADTTLLFTLTDTDGIKNRDPQRLMLTPTPDQPPQVAVQLDGIGTAVTPQARIVVAGQITDDYGIGRVWFELVIDQQDPRNYVIAELPEAPVAFHLSNVALDLKDLGLKPGQKLSVCVKASDLCNLNGPPNVSSGERWTLDVVTPEQLRAMLEARELALRQHFELTMQEMTDTRDLLSRLIVEPDEKSENVKKDIKVEKGAKDEKVEPGEEESLDSPGRRRELQFLRVQGALTNCRKGEPEVLGIAEGFDDLCKQHVNNRIDTEELKNRLKTGIAEPLHEIAEKMYPELERRLGELQTIQQQMKEAEDQWNAAKNKLENGHRQGSAQREEKALADVCRRIAPARNRAQRQAEEIILAMQKARSRMLELEQFNEIVELLRGIVESQEKLHEQTQQRHKEQIRGLLKED
jgi:hypothetical protein